jgi:4-amino-4-deoxy-L-arabinose transferase-like glycosyltransferase
MGATTPTATRLGRMTRLAPWLLILAGLAAGLAVVAPYRSETFTRSDGGWVRVPRLDAMTHTSDAWDYLQLGRQLYRGEGFTSLFTYPPFLPESVPGGKAILHDELTLPLPGPPPAPGDLERPPADSPSAPGHVESFPLLWRQPGFPVLVAAGFAVAGGPEPNAALALQILALVLLPLSVYLLARSVVSPGWAFWAAILALLVPLAIGARSPFVATTWTAVFWTLLFAFFLRARSAAAWVGTGLFLGLTVLFRLETWFLVPGLLVLLWVSHDRDRVKAAVTVLVLAVLVVAPWHLHLWRVTGEPFYNTGSLLFHATQRFPGWESSRTLAVRMQRAGSFLMFHRDQVMTKAVHDLLGYGRTLAVLPSPFLAPFLWLTLLRPPQGRVARGLVAGGAVAITVLVLALSPMEYAPRFVAPLVPIMAVGAVMTVARIPRWRALLVGAALAVGLAATAMALRGRGHETTGRLAAEDLNRLWTLPQATALHRGAVALVDSPTVYAWIWDRPAVWTPLPRDLRMVRIALPGTVALFTRAVGGADEISPETPALYMVDRASASAPSPPMAIAWPPYPDAPPKARP